MVTFCISFTNNILINSNYIFQFTNTKTNTKIIKVENKERGVTLKAKLWTPDFLMVSVTNFFLYFIYYILIASLTVFTVEQFHASTGLSGLVAGIFIIGMLFGRLYAGRSINAIGWKKMLYIGIIFSLIMIACYFFITNIYVLIVVRLFHGIGFGIASTATGTIVSEIIPDERRGEGTGYYALSTTIASAIGPFFSIFISEHYNFKVIFIICLIMILVAFFCAMKMDVPKMEFPSESKKGFSFGEFFEKKAIPLSIVGIFLGIAYSSVLSYINSYAQEIHLVDAASFFFIVYSVATLVTRPFTGKLFDAKGENAVLYPIMISFMVGLFLLSHATSAFTLLFSAIFIGIGFGSFLPSAQAVVVNLSPKQHMGLATSTLYMFVDFGCGFGPFILGIFIPMTGYTNMYMVMAVVVLLSLVLYYFVHGKKAKQLLHGKTM